MGTPKNNRRDKFWTNLRFGALLNGVRGRRVISPAIFRLAPLQFGSAAVRAWDGSSGSGYLFRRFLWKKGLSALLYSFNRGAWFRLRLLKSVPTN